ncbi:MAG: hypothetical protein M3Y86_01295 [Verrucomicrobiota bacterium]|nr:hypothetical protein [Verrucomicrobiota bacterium]
MGHVYRSLAYARRLEREVPNAELHFYMRDFREGIDRVRGEGFGVTVLPPRPTPENFRSGFTEHAPDLLIIDTLGSSLDLIAAARERAKAIVTVDDLEPSAADCDAVVNGILWGTRLLPERFGRAKVFQGVEYVQLREQFAEAHAQKREINPDVRKVLISTGGADGRGFAPQLMQALADLPVDLDVDVMAGPAHSSKERLYQEAETLSDRVRFAIVENAADMAGYLSAADIALITGGTVMFESAACGTPAVIVSSYEHQVPQASWFAKQNASLHLGYFPGEINKRVIGEAVGALATDLERRREMSAAGKGSVDGNGLERFVKIVIETFDGLS